MRLRLQPARKSSQCRYHSSPKLGYPYFYPGSRKTIEPIQSKYYSHAARWLAKAKQAYLQSGRKAEWQAYFTQLKTTYARRQSLQKELAKS
jgi:uncharacterized Zn finger protein